MCYFVTHYYMCYFVTHILVKKSKEDFSLLYIIIKDKRLDSNLFNISAVYSLTTVDNRQSATVFFNSRILLFSWFDSNVCTILRHLSLIAWFICEFIHFIMSCPFLKGLLRQFLSMMGIWYSCMNRHLFLK